MKYTTTDYRVDSIDRTIEIYNPITFVQLYRRLVKLWGGYIPFSAVVFPGTITDMFPVTEETILPVGVIKW
jgi:hypothetical protein